MIQHGPIASGKRLYTAQGELDAYHKLLDVSTDALAWSNTRERAA